MERLRLLLALLCLLRDIQPLESLDLGAHLRALAKSLSEANGQLTSAISTILRTAVSGIDGWGSGWYCKIDRMNVTMSSSPTSALCLTPGQGWNWTYGLATISYNGLANVEADVGGSNPWRMRTEAPFKADVTGISVDVKLEKNATGGPSMVVKSCKIKVDKMVITLGGSLDGSTRDYRTDFLRSIVLNFKFRIEHRLQVTTCSSIQSLMREDAKGLQGKRDGASVFMMARPGA